MKRYNIYDSHLLKMGMEFIFFVLLPILGYYLRFKWALFPVRHGIPLIQPYILLFIVEAIIWIFLFDKFKLYRKHYFISVLDEIYSIMMALLVGSVFIFTFTFFYRDYYCWYRDIPARDNDNRLCFIYWRIRYCTG